VNILIKKVLTKIEKEGFEAYIVGGFVRDFILGKKSYDIDICTNATPEALMIIFPFATFNNVGGISFKLKKYKCEISTYREELKYENRKPISLKFTNDVATDLKRRDFTINTFLMNKKGNILDYLDGLTDLENKEIRIVGDINKKLEEDPLRIMRAIRFATVLNFNVESHLKGSIKEKSTLITKLSNTRIREELDKILLSENVLDGLNILQELNILNILQISYDKVVPVVSLVGMYAQINCGYDLRFTKKEKEQIELLKEILKEDEINSKIVYKYGLNLSLIAASIKGIKKSDIKRIANNLPIKTIKDIKITPKEIETLNFDKKEISKVMEELENLIISGKIVNTKRNLIKYLIRR